MKRSKRNAKLITQAPDTQSENDTLTEETETTESISVKDEKKIKKIVKTAKKKIIENGKNSAIDFAIKRIITCLLSALLSAAIVLFTQHSFKDNFKDYIKDFISVHIGEFSELINHASALEDMNSAEAESYCKEHNIYEKSKSLLKVAISYSSDDEDINMLHSSFKIICEDLLDLSVMLYTTSGIEISKSESDDAYEDVLTISGLILDASSQMNVIAPSEDNSGYVQSQDSERNNIVMQLKAKLEIFVDLSNELCKKHKIKPFI